MSKRFVLAAAVAAAIGISVPNDAWAGPKVFAFFNTTSCINGTVEANAAGNLDPFVVEVFAGAGECLRVAGVAQGADLEATLVAPSGRVWQDDDSGGFNLPLIKAIAPTRGWHVLVFSQFAGTPSSTIDFTFDISRLPSTSSLCTPATPPRIAAAPAAKAFAEIPPLREGGTDD